MSWNTQILESRQTILSPLAAKSSAKFTLLVGDRSGVQLCKWGDEGVAQLEAEKIAHLIDKRMTEWTPDTLKAAYLNYGCAVVREAIDLSAINALRDLIDEAYKQTSDQYHVYHRELLALTDNRVSGFEIATNVPLFRSLLSQVFEGQHWREESVTARRIVVDNSTIAHGQEPLRFHLDAWFHGFQFVVNFWIPFQDCGVDAPCLQFVPVDYLSARKYSGFTGDKIDDSPRANFAFFDQDALLPDRLAARFGTKCFFKPVMKKGDVILSSNWTIHGSYRTSEMNKDRSSVEVRFVGDKLDVA